LPPTDIRAVRRSFAFKITVITLAWALLAIACAQVPPWVFWPVVFGALTAPVALACVGLLALYWLRRNWRVALFLLLVLGLTWPHVQRGLAFHPLRRAQLTDAWEPGPGPGKKSDPQAGKVRMLSANVRIFNVYAHLRAADNRSSKDFISWLARSPADVLCLQEFYHEPRGSRDDGSLFRVVDHLGKGGREAFVSKTLTNGIGAEFGMAIFSRFPIVRRGVIPFGRLSQNHAMWADLARPAAATGGRPDTVRVFNLHLQSMSLEESAIVSAATTKSGLKSKGRGLLRRFRNGAVARATQIDTVLARIARSPYPVLLAGDLNDLPYSYTYDQLADRLQNAWARTGTGIGATYNGKLPGVRIDHQFASPQWEVLDCRVHRQIKWSDHFPVEALYQLRR
jgi:endonuclease/exonuclease/phosphatase family metal-dependent hydrolase